MIKNLDRIQSVRDAMDLEPRDRIALQQNIEKDLPPCWRIVWDHPERVELYHTINGTLLGWHPHVNSWGYMLTPGKPIPSKPADWEAQDQAWQDMKRVANWLDPDRWPVV